MSKDKDKAPKTNSNPNRPVPPKTHETPYVLRKDYKGVFSTKASNNN